MDCIKTKEFRCYLTQAQKEIFESWCKLLKPVWNNCINLAEESYQRYLRKKFDYFEFPSEKWELSSRSHYNYKEPGQKTKSYLDGLSTEEQAARLGFPCRSISYWDKKKQQYALANRCSIRRFLFVEDPQKESTQYLSKERAFAYFPNDIAEKLISVDANVRNSFARLVVNEAFKAAKAGTRSYPKPKGKYNDITTIYNTQTNTIRIDDKGIQPFVAKSGFGYLEVNDFDTLKSLNVRSLRITKRPSGYYLQVSHLFTAQPRPLNGKAVGVDLGIAKVYCTSLGHHAEDKKFFRSKEKQLARLQRKLARQVKDSANYKKTKFEIASLHEQVAANRKHYAHQVSHRLTWKYDVIALEDLKLQNMGRRAKSKEKEDGSGYEHNNAKAKSGLNKSLLDAAPGMLRMQIEAKAKERDRKVIKVNPKYTSQTCSSCSHVSSDNRKSQAKFLCVSCGFTENADLNAAKNILALALNPKT